MIFGSGFVWEGAGRGCCSWAADVCGAIVCNCALSWSCVFDWGNVMNIIAVPVLPARNCGGGTN